MNDDRTDLAAQASRRALARAAAKRERIAAASPKGAYAALLANYLTPTHRDDPARGCALPRSAPMRRAAARQSAEHSPTACGPSFTFLPRPFRGARRRRASAKPSDTA